MENESWLKRNVRPLIALISFISVSIKYHTDPSVSLEAKYLIWTGAFITFYFGLRFFKK